MIVGALILTALILLVVFIARNMMPTRQEVRGDVGDLTSWVDPTPNHSSHHSFDGSDGSSH